VNVLVDSSVWSHAIRRSAPRGTPEVSELVELIREGRVVIIGPIRQELLSGIKTPEQYRMVGDRLRAFPDLELSHEDFEEAASCFSKCRARGIQGSNTDFLICAVALRRGFTVFSTDADFRHYARVLHIRPHRARREA
jgi:predicted nucleic acid-binding protein